MLEANGISWNGRRRILCMFECYCVYGECMHADWTVGTMLSCESGIASSAAMCDGCAVCVCVRSTEHRESVHVPNKHL